MKRIHIGSFFAFVFSVLLLTLCMSVHTEAAITQSATLSTNRTNGVVTYTVNGLDLAVDSTMDIQVVNTATKENAWKKTVTLEETNCKDGSYTDSFCLADVKYVFAKYSVSIQPTIHS